MKLLGKVWAVWAALMLLAVAPALADTVATGTDVACEHPEWAWGHDETHCWEYCAVCGELMYKMEHFSECFAPDDCLNCGTANVTIRKENIRHGADVIWDYDDTRHWLVCLTCGEAYEDITSEHYIVCWNPGECARCKAPYTGNTVQHGMSYIDTYEDGTHVRRCNSCDEIVFGPEAHVRLCTEDRCMVCDVAYTGNNIRHDNGGNKETITGYNDTYHWYTCKECGQAISEKHYTWYNDVVDDGVCSVCGATYEWSENNSSSSTGQTTTSSSGGTSSAYDYSSPLLAGDRVEAIRQGMLANWYGTGQPVALVSAPKTGKATLRATPSTSGKALKQLVDGTVLVVLGESGKFTEVSFDGMTGYVLTSALEMVDMAQLPMGEGMLIYPTTGGRGTTRINVRSGASARTHKIAEWVTGTTVLVWSVSEDGKWYEIEYEDVRGYVSADFLTVTQIYDFTVEQTDEETVYAAEA